MARMTKSKHPTPYDLLLEDLKSDKTPEQKIEQVTEFMREALAQKGVPRFRDFWEARKLFHDLFKECKDAIVKSKMWEKLTTMTAEARQIKEILDEQSTFAIEQIELAIKALAADAKEEKHGKGEALDVPKECKTLQRKSKLYGELHAQIQLYTTLFDRLKELREEVINTDMRIKHKNRLLKELSHVGDQFIPKRKELIAQLSEEFSKDVEFFASRHFGEAESRVPPHALRKEIQGFQTFAKAVLLNAKIFKQTRNTLAKCWDDLKKVSDAKRAEYEENKELYDKNAEEMKPFVAAFIELAADFEKPSRKQIDAEYEKVKERLRATQLDGRTRHGFFKQVDEAHEKWADERKKVESEKRQAKKRAFEDKVERLRREVEEIAGKTVEEIQKLIEELEKESDELFISLCDAAKIALLKKREKESSSPDDIETLLEDWVTVEEMLREKLERLRKAAGRSGFDFEQAMRYRQQIDDARKSLEEAEEAIESLQSKL